MPLMTRLHHLLKRHIDRFQFLEAVPKAGNRLSMVITFGLLRRNHTRHCPPMTGNHHGLPALNPSKQFGEAGPCLGH